MLASTRKEEPSKGADKATTSGLKSIHDILDKPNLTDNTFFGITEDELLELVVIQAGGDKKSFKIFSKIAKAIAKKAYKAKFTISHTLVCDYENTVIALALGIYDSSSAFLTLNDIDPGCTIETAIPPMGLFGLKIMNSQESRLLFTVEPIDSTHSKITAESQIVAYRFFKSDFGLGSEILDSLFDKISKRISTTAQNTTDTLDGRNYFNFDYIISPHKALKIYSKLNYCIGFFALSIVSILISISEGQPEMAVLAILFAIPGWYLLQYAIKLKREIEEKNKISQ